MRLQSPSGRTRSAARTNRRADAAEHDHRPTPRAPPEPPVQNAAAPSGAAGRPRRPATRCPSAVAVQRACHEGPGVPPPGPSPSPRTAIYFVTGAVGNDELERSTGANFVRFPRAQPVADSRCTTRRGRSARCAEDGRFSRISLLGPDDLHWVWAGPCRRRPPTRLCRLSGDVAREHDRRRGSRQSSLARHRLSLPGTRGAVPARRLGCLHIAHEHRTFRDQ